MHEVAIAQSILDIATETAKENGAERILSIRINVGGLSCVNLDSLQFAFSCISKESLAEGARILANEVKGASFALEMESIEVE